MAVTAAARRNLRRLLLFAAAPVLIQIPYALRQFTIIIASPDPVEGFNTYMTILTFKA